MIEGIVIDDYKKKKGKVKETNLEVIPPTKEEEEDMKILLGETFEQIIQILKTYVKLKEDYYPVIAVWIIGTYRMDSFHTFPYLFLNAQKGSGKTRLLKLIEVLTNKGILLASMREAVLFRLADKGYSLMIDELEGLDRKENAPLRELLNACYKRGTKVFRMKKVGEGWDFEEFEPFTPIAIANIGGLDDVLGDRCIGIHLDKSNDKSFALRQENFNNNDQIINVKKNLDKLLVYMCSLSGDNIGKAWELYVNDRYGVVNSILPTTTYTTLTTLTTHNYTGNSKKDGGVVSVDTKKSSVVSSVVSDVVSFDEICNKIHDSGLAGRHLELLFPLLDTALLLNEKLFDDVLKFGIELSKIKKDDDVMESPDVSLIEFVSKLGSEMEYDKFRFIHELSEKFRFYLGIRKEREQEEINPRWIGRALKRLGLIVHKRRLSSGMEVKLNIPKATKLLESLT